MLVPLTEIVLKAIVATVNTPLNHLHWSHLFEYDTKKRVTLSEYNLPLLYPLDTIISITGLHDAMRLFNNRSQMMG